MNTQLQELINEMKGEVSMAYDCAKSWESSSPEAYHSFSSAAKAIEKYIPKLEKILNEGSVAASSKVHFQVDFKAGTITKTRSD